MTRRDDERIEHSYRRPALASVSFEAWPSRRSAPASTRRFLAALGPSGDAAFPRDCSSRRPALASLGPSGDAAFPRRACANEGCVRAAEEGERYCATCGLERSLFRREVRRPPAAGPRPGREDDRR